jgi:secreted Zn-dependent insulinase-like peptidase
MKLVLCGKASVEELENLAVDLFSSIKNLECPKPTYTELPFTH